MFHYLQLGYFDHAALRKHKVVPLRALDMELAERLFLEMGGTVSQDGLATLDGCVVYQEEGKYITCEIPLQYGRAVEFIARLARETGCDIAYAEGGGTET